MPLSVFDAPIKPWQVAWGSFAAGIVFALTVIAVGFVCGYSLR